MEKEEQNKDRAVGSSVHLLLHPEWYLNSREGGAVGMWHLVTKSSACIQSNGRKQQEQQKYKNSTITEELSLGKEKKKNLTLFVSIPETPLNPGFGQQVLKKEPEVSLK